MSAPREAGSTEASATEALSEGPREAPAASDAQSSEASDSGSSEAPGDSASSELASGEPVTSSVAWRLELDVPAERSVAHLRLVGAVVALTMGTVLAFGGGGSVAWTLIVLTWLVGLGWIGAYVVGRRKARRAHAWFVEAREKELVVALGRDPARVLWRDVRGVDVDEDRLDVVVRHARGELRLPSVWRGMGPHAIAERIEAQRIETSQERTLAEMGGAARAER